MKLNISGHHMTGIGENFPTHVNNSTNKIIDKYYKNRIFCAKVKISKDNQDKFTSSIVVLQKGRRHYLIKGDGNSDNPYEAFNIALAKMSKGLRRFKRKITRH